MTNRNRIGTYNFDGYKFYLTFNTEDGRKYFMPKHWGTTTYKDGTVTDHSNISEQKAKLIQEINEAIESNVYLTAQYGPQFRIDEEIDPETILQNTISVETRDPNNPRIFKDYE